MNQLSLKRALSAALSSAMILLSPGFAPYQAAAAEFSPLAAPAPEGVRGVSLPLVAEPLSATVGDLGAVKSLEIPAAVGADLPALAVSASGPTAQVSALTAATKPAAAQTPTTSARAAAKSVQALSASIHETLNRSGETTRANESDAAALGRQVNAEMTGEKLFTAGGALSPSESVVRQPEAPAGSHGYLARPAGEDISRSAQALLGASPSVAPPRGGNNGGNGGGNSDGDKIPLIPRLLTSAFAASPVLLAWTLIAGGSLVSGGLVAAASLAVAAMPWMSAGTPKVIRSVPGVVIAGLGVAALLGGAIPAGALAVLGGWGLVRFARDQKKWEYRSGGDLIATFFGAFAAVAGSALALAHPAGAILVGARYLALPFTLPLLAQLPGWIGETIAAPVHGAYLTFKDNFRVFGAVRNDTVWFKKLSAYTEAAVQKPWNVVWLGLVVWLPILAVEAVWQAVGVAWSVALTAARALPMALWGLSHGLSRESKAAQFFGAWAGTMFKISKVGAFNRAEALLTPAANGQSRVKSLAATLGIRGLQLLWVPVSGVLSLAALFALGPIAAFKSLSTPVPPGGVSPDYQRLENDPLPSKVPEVPTPKTVASTPGKLLATAIALVPAALIGWPLVLGGSGLMSLALVPMFLGIAAMPLMPESAAVPAWVRNIPALALKYAGFFSALGAGFYFATGLPVGPILALGLVAFGSGIGLERLIVKLQDQQTKAWKLEEAEYIGGFVSALGASSALGLALLGLGGTLFGGLMIAGGVSSVFLLAHLPKAFWQGVGAAVVGIPAGVRPVYDVLGFWGKSDYRTQTSDFRQNMSSWFRYWTNKSGWNAIYFIVPWGAAAVLMLAEYAGSLALGLVSGAVRAPANFAWSATYNAAPGKRNLWGPDGRATRFFAGFAKAWRSWSTGEFSRQTVFGALTNRLIPALGEKNPVSGRPTLKATGALLLAFVLKAAWLVYAAAALALGWIPALVAGIRNAAGPKAKNPNGGDPDRPTDRLGIFGL